MSHDSVYTPGSKNYRDYNDYPSHSKNYSIRNNDSSLNDNNYSSHISDYPFRDRKVPFGNNDYSLHDNNYSSRTNDYTSHDNSLKFIIDDYSPQNEDYSALKTNSSINRSSHSFNSQEVTFKGIRNICNTCFMNSVLQVLINLPQFMSDMISSLNKVDQQLENSSFIKEICRIFYEYTTTKKETLQINKFYDLIRERIPYLGDGSQHDVAEFFQLFAESCKSELTSYISSTTRNKHSGETLLSKTQMLLYDPFMKNFGISIVTSVVCGNCNNVISEEVQTNFILHLPLVFQTLEDCISHSFEREPIQTSSSSKNSDYNYRRYEYDYRYRRTMTHESNNDGYCCSKCRNKSSFYLCSSFYRIPRFLFIQIARFDSSLTKNSAPINVPDRIDLQQYINDNHFAGPEPIRVRNRNEIDTNSLYSIGKDDGDLYSYQKTTRRGRKSQEGMGCQSVFEDEKLKRKPSYPNASYHLVSVILHNGTFSGGHYTAAINPQGSRGSWTVISDDVVLENSSFNRTSPYCFIYQIDQ